MALPTTRQTFKEYILRRLGFPVIEINVDDEQIEDRIDDAISYYQEYHFDGAERFYMKHKITQQDKDNRYITVPDNVIGVIRVLEFNPAFTQAASALFNVRYQMALNDMFNITSQSLIPYYLAMRHLNLYDEMFNGETAIIFNRRTDKIFIETDWEAMGVGSFLVFECYRILDPAKVPEVWRDRWLLRYATALVKKQWGENLSKFSGIQLVGGVQFNGDKIYSDATEEIRMLEDEMINSYSIPATDFIG